MIKIFSLLLIASIFFLTFSSCTDSSEKANNYSVQLYPIKVDKHWGYIDKNGEIMIEPRFYSASWFNESRAIVSIEPNTRSNALINKRGEVIFYDSSGYLLNNYNEGMVGFLKNGVMCFINSFGEKQFCLDETVTQPISSSFSNGRLLVRYKNGYFAYLDRNGKEVLLLKKGIPHSYHEQIARIVYSLKTCYIDTMGLEIFCVDGKGDDFEGGLAWVDIENNPFAVNKKGKVQIDNIDYNSVSPFYDGCALVEKNGKFGYIDKKGKEIIPLIYDRATPFLNNAAFVSKTDDTWICINKQNEIIFDKKVDNIAFPLQFFRNDLAYIYADSTWGYINRKGEFIWKSEFNLFDNK